MRQRLTLTFLLLALLPYVRQSPMDFRHRIGGSLHQRPQETAQPAAGTFHPWNTATSCCTSTARTLPVEYKELNVDLDRYTRAFDVIDVMYQSLRTVLNAKDTYTTVSEPHRRLQGDADRVQRQGAEARKGRAGRPPDTHDKQESDRRHRNDGEQLYKSLNDLVLYATGAAACSTSDLLMVMEAINGSLDDIERHLNRAYMETWRYIQVRIGYWKEKIYQARSRQEIIDGAFGRWRGAGRLDY